MKTTDANYGVPGHHHHHEEDEHDDDHDDHAALGDEDDHEDEHSEEEELVSIDLEQTRYDFRGELRDLGSVFDRVKFTAGIADYKHTEFEGDETGTVFENEGWETRLEAVQAERELGTGILDGAVGVQLSNRDFSAIGEEAFVPPSETDEWGLFVLQRWDTGQWGLEGGLRVENREIDTASQSRSFDTVSASGSVFFRPAERAFVAVTLAHSERAPTDVELFADGPHIATNAFEIGNSNIDTESALSLELSARFARGDWTFEGAIFTAEYDGFIEAFATGEEEDELPVFEFRQEDASLSGFEGRISGPVYSGDGWVVNSELTAEYVNGELDGGGNLPRIPPLTLSGGLELELSDHAFGVDVTWADVQDDVADFENKTQSYVLVDAGWTYTGLADQGLRFILQGRNLTDEEARLHSSFLKDQLPLPGRNVRAAVIFDF